MTQTLETGKKTTLSKVFNPSDTVIDVATAPNVTKGRVYLFNGQQEERCSYNGIIGNQLQNVVRNLSKTAIPATAGTGLKWIAGTRVKFVAMHDQLMDIQEDAALRGKITFIDATGRFSFPRYTTAQRDEISTWENGEVITNTTTGTNQQYLTGSWTDFGSSTTPNGSEVQAGKFQQSTDAAFNAGTDLGNTGSQNVPKNSQIKTKNDSIDAAIASLALSVNAKEMTYGESISARDILSLIPDGTTDGRAYKYISTSGLQSVFNGPGSVRVYQGNIALSNNLVVTCYLGSGSSGTVHLSAGTITGNTFSYGTTFTYDILLNNYNFIGFDLVKLSATSFAAIALYFDGASGQRFVSARILTVSGTTITSGSNTILHGPGTIAMTYSGVCLVDTNKVAISYVYNSSNHIVAFTVSGTTITGGSPASGLAIQGKMCQISVDKVAVSDGSNVRIVTFTGTTPVIGNNLAIGSTYTPRSIRNIGSSLALFTGTTGGNTQAFVVDCTGVTPAKGTTVTVLESSTSDDGILINNGQVVVVTGSSTTNTKYYFYSYTGTTLSFLHSITTTGIRTGYAMIDQISNLTAICGHFTSNGIPTQCIFFSDRKYYTVGIAKVSGILNDIKYIAVNSGIVSGYTALVPGLPYYATNNGINVIGDLIIGKSLSSTDFIVDIPTNNL